MDDFKPILWLAMEDYAGLWEAVWQLRALDSGAESDALVGRARASLRELLARDLVALYLCQEPYGEVVEVRAGEVDALLSSDESWREPAANAVSIRFGATPAGQEAYDSWLD
jgi:hypothetical protein